MSSRWLIPGSTLTQIQAADAQAAAVLGVPWVIDDPGHYRLAGIQTVPVARYRSFAQFQANLQAKTIDPAYRWVLYDPESWPDTPEAEQADPGTAMGQFGQYAHAHGYRVICAPARDLGNVDSTFPKHSGEDLGAWYLRTGIPHAAAEHADVISVQSQAATLSPGTPGYAEFVTGAKTQALGANPYVKVLAGVSTKYGEAADMAAAAKSVQVAGYWLNRPDGDTGKACEFLRLMGGGGT